MTWLPYYWSDAASSYVRMQIRVLSKFLGGVNGSLTSGSPS